MFYIIMYHLLCITIILYTYICIRILYLYAPKRRSMGSNKKICVYIFILIFLLHLYKIYKLKFYQITLFFHELCDPSNPNYLTYTLSLFLRSTFSTRYVRINAM